MKLRTILELKSKYPNEVLISTDASESGKYAAYLHLVAADGKRRLVVQTDYSFDTSPHAVEYLRAEIETEISARMRYENAMFGLPPNVLFSIQNFCEECNYMATELGTDHKTAMVMLCNLMKLKLTF